MEDISKGLEPFRIPIEDTHHLGSFLLYITDSIFPDGTPVTTYEPESSSADGESDEDSTNETYTCSCVANHDDHPSVNICTVENGATCDCVSDFGNFYYMPSGNCDDHKDIDRQLLNLEALPERLPLVECSPICPCSGNCANRLTQRGVLISTTIRPSSSGVGLGLFYISTTHDDLPQGCFVSLYAGEYLTTDQARQRWSNQRVHEEGQGNHILSLKLPGKTWHIDPRFKGNIGRFLNHSCDPNCVIQIVRWGIDSLPRAAIFTKRGVRVGEELTFDYANASGSVDLAAQLDRQNVIEDGAGRTKCLCGSQKCRGWMPFDETL